jgi:hypothetical protein
MSTYQYSRLPGDNTIRILHVEPNDYSAPVSASLEAWDGKQTYEALSWSWGTVPPQASIEIKHKNGNKTPLMIKANLEAALKHLRRSDEPRRLWIDAVCKSQGLRE